MFLTPSPPAHGGHLKFSSSTVPGSRPSPSAQRLFLNADCSLIWLRAALAHQLGCLNATMTSAHLASWWAKYQVLVALADALDPPQDPDTDLRIGFTRRLVGALLRFLSGSSRFFNWPERCLYPSLLKRDIYAADRWAKEAGASQDVAEFLESHEQATEFASPYPWLDAIPGAERRIARLRQIDWTLRR